MKSFFVFFFAICSWGAIPSQESFKAIESEKLKSKLKELTLSNKTSQSNALIFDLPMTYNKPVSKWVNYFQTKGAKWFREYLERSSKYLPFIQNELQNANLPTDLAFMVMIESGFSSSAVSIADAVGPWQFIEGTAQRYGLKKNWWLDERRDFRKSTHAAIKYIKDLYNEFGSWYLVAASYNMGENGLRRQVVKHKTKDYWTLIQKNALPEETQNYVPKILAAMLITKAPNLYGFRSLEKRDPLKYDYVTVPGGTDLNYLADILGVTKKSIKELNSELIIGYVPKNVTSHTIRVPSGAGKIIAEYISQKGKTEETF
jgi:membrane-bound lytic murein transglycosylase D